MSQKEAIITEAANEESIKDLTAQLIETFRLMLNQFMYQNNKTVFGPNDHIQMINDKDNIHVSYVMSLDGKIQMTTTMGYEIINKYRSLSVAGSVPEKEAMN